MAEAYISKPNVREPIDSPTYGVVQPYVSFKRTMTKPVVLVVGTLDTKRDETLYLRSQILSHGSCDVKLLDVGRELQSAASLQIPPDQLVPRLLRISDPAYDLPRGEMINAQIHRCLPIVNHLVSGGLIHGVVAAAGTSGSSLATALMRACPVGFPKLMVGQSVIEAVIKSIH